MPKQHLLKRKKTKLYLINNILNIKYLRNNYLKIQIYFYFKFYTLNPSICVGSISSKEYLPYIILIYFSFVSKILKQNKLNK